MKLLDLHLGRPLVRGGLTLFPVWNGAAITRRGYDLNNDSVSVSERSGASVVSELVVTNNGPRPVVVLAGEILQGGQQNRVAIRSVVVDRQQALVLDVRCVEEGRWSGSGTHRRTGRRAPVSVRTAGDQSAVWDRVRQSEQEYGATDTHSLVDATHDAAAQAAALISGVRPLAFQCGVLVGISGQPLALDVFDSPRTLAAVWDDLLLSAAVDAVQSPAIPTPGRRARRFLDRLLEVPVPTASPGSGSNVRGSSPYVRLDSLVWKGRAVHTSASNVRHELVGA